MTTYNPINQGQISSADPLGPASCVAYSFAYAIGDATNGRVHPTGRTIRSWTGDVNGGLELQQCDAAVASHLGLDFRTDVYTRAEFYALLARGYGAVQLIGYGPVGDTKFDGSPGFLGNHAWYVPPTRKIMDPLADGRRAGIYEYHGEVYPTSLIDAGAAYLIVGTAPHQRHVGPDHFEASFIHLEAAAPAIRYKVTVDPGRLAYYPAHASTRTVDNTGAILAHTIGFTAACSAPIRFTWVGHGVSLRLVRLTSGAHIGKWVNAGSARIHLKEV